MRMQNFFHRNFHRLPDHRMAISREVPRATNMRLLSAVFLIN
jgi:hypothetical protein